jgi:hypothetical protein
MDGKHIVRTSSPILSSESLAFTAYNSGRVKGLLRKEGGSL